MKKKYWRKTNLFLVSIFFYVKEYYGKPVRNDNCSQHAHLPTHSLNYYFPSNAVAMG